MRYHPDVEAAIAALRAVAPSLVAMLERDHPHLLTALVSVRLDDAVREAAMDVIEVQGDVGAAKALLGVMPWVEENFDPVAMGPGFKARRTSADFDLVIGAALTSHMNDFEAAACLLVVTDALICSTEKAALILVDAHRQVYEVASDLISTIGFVLWASENPSVPLAGMMRAEVHAGSTFSSVVADTLGACEFVLGYLMFGQNGPPAVLPSHRFMSFEATQVCRPAEACALARELGPELGPAAFDACAAGHLGLGAGTIAVRDMAGAAVGVARLDLAGRVLCVGRIVARGGAEGENIVRMGATETIRLTVAHRRSVPFSVQLSVPPFGVLETRWDHLTLPYRSAKPGVTAGAFQAFGPDTLERLAHIIEGLREIASRV